MRANEDLPVAGTSRAIDLIERLKRRHGPLAFLHAGGTCDGVEPLCLTRDELLPGAGDLHLGEVAGSPIYVDRTKYDGWGRPAFVIDVAPGPASGLFLAGLEEEHFVTRPPDALQGFLRWVDARLLNGSNGSSPSES